MMNDYSFSSDLSMDTSSSCPNTPEKDGVPVSTESPRAKDWQRLLQMSDGYGDKNMFINDAIHGHIKIPGICRAVIDTPQFDRLRGIKQLGTTFYVYPSAKHTR
ncbi:deoxynucleoside triphosphate triphosphohydrolase SAMHD1 [Eurytemora carolleeae]|uniref:deoxynucleoside triphosphate triphosphohydrolase SAMHD1 n=1 Tax=Eurytemora carolleeae TaxID=1294199 RepID=UPI000C76B3C0|nr:deoxynucleoside triphosphate triphosphohydrolase SAMHD1 [Eurytemora carolleeae]|eukprot:XP_023347595.1 deoxynucleoside triphosphate triphosphohydrolase SAMHD1-like [Eurytemora affinis]